MAENLTNVYSSALQRYKDLLERGEGAKKDFGISRVMLVEENKRFEIT